MTPTACQAARIAAASAPSPPRERGRDGQRREVLEAAAGAQFAPGEHVVPDPTRAFPRRAADGGRGQGERPVGDARVVVHAAVVVGGAHIAAHVVRLRVAAQAGVVVGGPGVQHAAQRRPLHPGEQQVGPDQPVGLARVLPGGVLRHQAAEHVGHRLVQGTRLAGVGEVGRPLDDAVGEFVADHVEAGGEAPEDLPVPVAEHHARAVPERVLVAPPVMDGAAERQPGAVDRVAPVHLVEEPPGGAEAVVGLVRGGVTGCGCTLRTDGASRELLGAAGVRHLPGRAGGCGRTRRADRGRGAVPGGPRAALVTVGVEGEACQRGDRRVALGEVAQQERRDDVGRGPPGVGHASSMPAPTDTCAAGLTRRARRCPPGRRRGRPAPRPRRPAPWPRARRLRARSCARRSWHRPPPATAASNRTG